MKNYKVIEDNGGGLTLVVFAADGETIEYIHSGYEYNPGQLSADLHLLQEGSNPARYWDGNDLDSVDGMENPEDMESWFPWNQKGQGWEVGRTTKAYIRKTWAEPLPGSFCTTQKAL